MHKRLCMPFASHTFLNLLKVRFFQAVCITGALSDSYATGLYKGQIRRDIGWAPLSVKDYCYSHNPLINKLLRVLSRIFGFSRYDSKVQLIQSIVFGKYSLLVEPNFLFCPKKSLSTMHLSLQDVPWIGKYEKSIGHCTFGILFVHRRTSVG